MRAPVRGMFGGSGPRAVPVRIPWQAQYAAQGWDRRLSQPGPDEPAFQAWVKQNNVPITEDYDMRAFYRSGERTQINPNDHMIHYSDRYKTPLHESFSGESIYANPASHPPMWNDRDQLVDASGRVLYDERARR